MKELIRDVKILAGEEVTRSMINNPLFNSTHEGYAVIKEEIEEAQDELENVSDNLSNIWDCIKNNNLGGSMLNVKYLRTYAINLAAEAVQVAAMAQKYIDSFKEVEE